MEYLFLFGATFVFVTFKAFQQRNVIFENIWWMPLASYGMAACEVFVISSIAQQGDAVALMWCWIAMGTGGTLGGWTGIYLHKRIK